MQNYAMSSRLALALTFISFVALATLIGFYLGVTQIHSPQPARLLGLALIWPYAFVNRAFHAFVGPAPLSATAYYIEFAVASVAQLAYLFGVFSLVKIAVARAAGWLR